MTPKRSRKTDPLESLIETKLLPGRFVSYGPTVDFVRDLSQVEERMQHLMGNEPARAVALYETFLAGCYEKAEEIDDSSGNFGQFVSVLFCGWIRARRAAAADPDETAARLVAWMEEDPYGFASDLEKTASKVLDRAGLAALVQQVRGRFDSAAAAQSATVEAPRRVPDYECRVWGERLRSLYLAQENVEGYVALVEETIPTAGDCHALATMWLARRKPEKALSWVERGLVLDEKTPHNAMARYDLTRLKRHLLVRLGRSDEALQAVWAEYRKHPDKYSYDDLMRHVPKAERAAWHGKAMEAATGSDLHSHIDLLLETKERERLAGLVRRTGDGLLEGVSHHVTQPAAKKLERNHPDLGARLWLAQGMRIVKAGKSKYYDAALVDFERARCCYEKAGLAADWQRVVEQLRSEHRRKTGFMAGFEAMLADSKTSEKPSFLERAKARWGPRPSED